MERERLTITLRKDIIKKVDKTIDGFRIRNRSHAIEYFLARELGPKVKKALILAGGRGIKMRPFTYEMPKSMIPVHNRPILEHIIDHLRESNIREIIIAIDYLGEKIREYFSDGSKFGVKITYLDAKKPSGTTEPLISAKNIIGNEAFILYHGDVLANIDINDLIDYHELHNKLITMSLTSVADPSLYGSVKLHGSEIVDFKEKAGIGPEISRLINAGIYIISPAIFDNLSSKKNSSLEKEVFPKLVKKGQINGYVFDGVWFDVSTPEIYARALKEWK